MIVKENSKNRRMATTYSAWVEEDFSDLRQSAIGDAMQRRSGVG
jgi:hypothetical protein